MDIGTLQGLAALSPDSLSAHITDLAGALHVAIFSASPSPPVHHLLQSCFSRLMESDIWHAIPIILPAMRRTDSGPEISSDALIIDPLKAFSVDREVGGVGPLGAGFSSNH